LIPWYIELIIIITAIPVFIILVWTFMPLESAEKFQKKRWEKRWRKKFPELFEEKKEQTK